MKSIQMHPVDTWFFRDSTPFSSDTAPQEGVSSMFPPHPPTVVGALRAALARCNGWNGFGRWPERLGNVLGDGPDHLGTLSFAGPLLLRNGEPLFRCPQHVLGAADGDDQWTPSAFLRPGSPVQCDLGDSVRLPQIAGSLEEGLKLMPGRDIWVTTAGMNQLLKGHFPSGNQLVAAHQLWATEGRIGLERKSDTRTAKEGMLYSTRHVRVASRISLGLQVVGVPDAWRSPNGIVPLGGESRLAECTEWKCRVSVEQPIRDINRTGRFAVVAITPLYLERGAIYGHRSLDGLRGARVVSACLSRAIRIGGWNSLSRCPRPLRSALPPGSVLFCEVPPEVSLELSRSALVAGLYQLGSRQEWGFGLVAIGAWPSKQEIKQ